MMVDFAQTQVFAHWQPVYEAQTIIFLHVADIPVFKQTDSSPLNNHKTIMVMPSRLERLPSPKEGHA